MVLITVEMIRRKSEHNEKEIRTLEELSLHQENIEKIEHLQNWCKNLQILLLQSNLISKIENLGKLKNLQYLNLALNNIERIENLSGLESLTKLDLTLNFVSDLKSVANLKDNFHLNILILTGNPCCDYRHYRDFVITVLPQISELDGVTVSRSERIQARHDFVCKLSSVEEDQKAYMDSRSHEEVDGEDDNEDDDSFWSKPSKNTPEERVRIAERAQKIRQKSEGTNAKIPEKKAVRLFNKMGQPVNINEPKIPFKLYDDDKGNIILDVAVYKFLDTSHLDVDVQPTYVTVKIKGKSLQLVLDDEVKVDSSSCRRSTTTGALVVTMPKAFYTPQVTAPRKAVAKPSPLAVDIRSIVQNDWQDDPDVPPLE